MKGKKITTIVSSFLLSLLLTGCSGCQQRDGDYDYVHPDFITEYTIEEHIERITTRTEEIFEEEIKNGDIVDYTVEIVYAFYDNDPEYFLVELEYAKEWGGKYDNPNDSPNVENDEYITYQTKYKHFIGYIVNDRYWYGLRDYWGSDIKTSFKDGRSVYAFNGYEKERKYYGMCKQAVEVQGEMLFLYDWYKCDSPYGVSPEFHTHRASDASSHIADYKYNQEALMRGNYKFSSDEYKKEN